MARVMKRLNSIGIYHEDVYFEDGPDKGKLKGKEWVARINVDVETELDGILNKVIEVPVGEQEVIKFMEKVLGKAKEVLNLEA